MAGPQKPCFILCCCIIMLMRCCKNLTLVSTNQPMVKFILLKITEPMTVLSEDLLSRMLMKAAGRCESPGRLRARVGTNSHYVTVGGCSAKR